MPISFLLFPWPFPHFRRGSLSFRVLPAWHRDFLTANRRGREQRRRLNRTDLSKHRYAGVNKIDDIVIESKFFSFEPSANRENFKVVLSDKLTLDCGAEFKGGMGGGVNRIAYFVHTDTILCNRVEMKQ
jgi:hypothetical protein